MQSKVMRLLLVEDDEPKLTAIREHLSTFVEGLELTLARSFSMAMRALDNQKFDIAILDMSLPTFDLARDKAGGGEPLGYGGRDLLRTIEAESTASSCIVVTQYNSFEDGNRTVEQLDKDLRSEFGDFFLGVVFYSGKQGRWRSELKQLIEGEILK